MRVVVNGQGVEVAEGATLLDAARAAGADVPTLCFDERLSPYGGCRLCLVAVADAKGPVAACTTPATAGISISTEDPEVRETARRVLELLVGSLPVRALEQRSELGRLCRRLGVEASSFGTGTPARGVDHSHPYVKLDRDLCIACARCVQMCDEVQGTFALELAGRGFDTVVMPGTGGPWIESDCVACGGCVDTCPTGALSEPGLLDPAPIERVTATTCGYCGVGCGLDVHVRDGGVAAVTPQRDAPVNRGHACVKGRFAHGFVRSGDRLTTPLIRRGGELSRASWEEALDVAASAIERVISRRGRDAVAAISSARATNEENYLVQKLMRTVIGTNNVDNCSRLCHAPSAAGLTATFGLSGGTNCFEDFDHADCFLLAGANPTEAHPVVGARVKQRVIEGARLVVVDPRRIELAGYADVHLQNRPGSNVAVFNAFANVLVADGLLDERFLAGRADGLEELRAVLDAHPPEWAEEISGVPADEIRKAAHIYGEASCPAIVYGLGITEHAHGTDGVRTLANLAILTGHVGTPLGAGVNPLRGQNNVQGASDVGALPDLLPGYRRVADEAARAEVAAVWGSEVPPKPGLRILDMFSAALHGELGVLWVVGEDIAQTDPDTSRVEAAIDACGARDLPGDLPLAHRPACGRRAAGGFVPRERRHVHQLRPPLPARPAGARAAWRCPLRFRDRANLLAARLGADLHCPTPAAAMDELAAVAPLFAGLSHERLDREGPVHWPCRSADDPGQGVLYRERFETPNGRAQLAARPYLPPGETPDPDYPLLLLTGRRLDHYNAGTMTRRTANLILYAHERIESTRRDAARLGIDDGASVIAASRRGEVRTDSRRHRTHRRWAGLHGLPLPRRARQPTDLRPLG